VAGHDAPRDVAYPRVTQPACSGIDESNGRGRAARSAKGRVDVGNRARGSAPLRGAKRLRGSEARLARIRAVPEPVADEHRDAAVDEPACPGIAVRVLSFLPEREPADPPPGCCRIRLAGELRSEHGAGGCRVDIEEGGKPGYGAEPGARRACRRIAVRKA